MNQPYQLRHPERGHLASPDFRFGESPADSGGLETTGGVSWRSHQVLQSDRWINWCSDLAAELAATGGLVGLVQLKMGGNSEVNGTGDFPA